jgi:hypothetical protein
MSWVLQACSVRSPSGTGEQQIYAVASGKHGDVPSQIVICNN